MWIRLKRGLLKVVAMDVDQVKEGFVNLRGSNITHCIKLKKKE